MSLPRALVRVVSSRLDEAGRTFLERAPLDLERAAQPARGAPSRRPEVGTGRHVLVRLGVRTATLEKVEAGPTCLSVLLPRGP